MRFADTGLTPTSSEFLSAEFIISTVSLRLVILCCSQQKSTGCSFNEFLGKVTLLTGNILLSPMPLIVAGDFNIYVDPFHNNANAFTSLLSSSGLQQLVHSATHKKGHTSDLLITLESDPPVIDDLSITEGISDHSAIMAKIRLQRPPVQKKSAKTTQHFCN